MKRKLLCTLVSLAVILCMVPTAMAGSSEKTDYLNLDFDGVGNTDRLTSETVGDVISGASFTNESYYSENKDTVSVKVVADSDTSKGNVLQMVNKSAQKGAIALKIPFTGTYRGTGEEYLVWEFDYKIPSTTGLNNNFMEIFDSSDVLSLMLQRNDTRKVRFKGSDSNVTGSAITINLDEWIHQRVILDVKGGTDGKGEIVSVTYTDEGVTKDAFANTDAVLKTDASSLYLYLTLRNPKEGEAFPEQEYYVDNINIYSVPKMKIKSANVNTHDRAIVDRDVEVRLTNEMADSSLLATTVTAGGNIVPKEAYNVACGEDKKSVTISFTDGMEYDTNYVISFGGAKDANGFEINDSVSFLTEPAPAITAKKVAIYKGIGETADEKASLKADGSLQSVSVTLANHTEAKKDIVLIYAMYNSAGRLENVSYVSTVLEGKETASVIQGLNVSESMSGGFIKEFIWTKFSELNPYVAPIIKDIE